MKRIVTLLLAAGLVLGAAGAGQAADVKVKGMWDFSFQWANTSFKKGNNGNDYFAARQRLRTQVDFIASESLKGVVFFEIGDQNWGKTAQGASLGTDGNVIEVRYSYIDWVVPNTDLKVRMGLQPIALPGFVSSSAVLDHDAAGVVLSYNFNENVGATLFWSRIANDNYEGDSKFSYDKKYRSDAFDMFGLTVPMTFDGVKVTPWGAFGTIGRNALAGDGSLGHPDGSKAQWGLLKHSMSVVGSDGSFAGSKDSSGTAWWLGLTGDITLWNPFRLAFDFNYGSVDMGSSDGAYTLKRRGLDSQTNNSFDFKRSGWMVSLLAEYKFDMVTPGLLFWYASGDNSNAFDGSERMPSVRSAWKPTGYGFDGNYAISTSVMMGNDPSGLWALQLRFKDISFIEDLTHLFSVTYYRGTNSKDMAQYTTPYASVATSDNVSAIGGYTYLTKSDSAWEVNLDSTYKIYENLFLNVELGYIHLGLKESTWGQAIIDDTNKNNFKASVNMRYTF